MAKRNDIYDAVIIGGGPGGSTTAALLAQKGRRVLVLEKSHFPRYCVGESLMPYCYFPLERLGVIDKIKDAGFPKVEKHSVQFVTTNGKVSAPFYFFQHLKHPAATTFQVIRGPFDKMLLDNARQCGAQVMEGVTVRDAIRDKNGAVIGVTAQDEDGTTHQFHGCMTVDASGRDALMLNRNNWKLPDPELKKVAIWTYYKGAMRDCGLDQGATTVAYLPEKGWFWFIPLPDDMVSVGVVAERDYLYRDLEKSGRDPKIIFEREIENNTWIKDHLEPGTQTDKFHVTGDYSYRSRYCASDGLVLVGDAYAFLDPVFSSGIFLALRSGELVADAIDDALERNDTSASSFEAYGDAMCQGMEAMRKLVYAFYDQEFSFRSLMMAHPELRGDLTDCLIGHLFKDFEAMFKGVAEFAQLPQPLPYGRAQKEPTAASS